MYNLKTGETRFDFFLQYYPISNGLTKKKMLIFNSNSFSIFNLRFRGADEEKMSGAKSLRYKCGKKFSIASLRGEKMKSHFPTRGFAS